MRPRLLFVFLVFGLFLSAAWAGGSIGWSDVKDRISKSDPELVAVIERAFSVNKVGGAVRLGHHFGERVGERVPPYEFNAVQKSSGKKGRLMIDQSDDFEFTGRFRFTWTIE